MFHVQNKISIYCCHYCYNCYSLSRASCTPAREYSVTINYIVVKSRYVELCVNFFFVSLHCRSLFWIVFFVVVSICWSLSFMHWKCNTWKFIRMPNRHITHWVYVSVCHCIYEHIVICLFMHAILILLDADYMDAVKAHPVCVAINRLLHIFN